MQLKIVPYTPQDNEAALALERISSQPKKESIA